MRFIVTDKWLRVPPKSDFPVAILRRDNWNDYGYKTMFSVTIWLSRAESIELENVKVLERGQEPTATRFRQNKFRKLGPQYCSLGQEPSYYETLRTLKTEVWRSYLTAMRDYAFSAAVRSRFAGEDGIETSLLRFGGAERALSDAPQILGLYSTREVAPPSSDFSYRMPDKGPVLNFRFAKNSPLPSRLSVVIGYNGSGKTRLLSKIAMLAHSDRTERAKSDFIKRNGSYSGIAPAFGGVIAVSYSAFDEFDLPGGGQLRGDSREADESIGVRSSGRNYTYCGLRRIGPEGRVEDSLKSIRELEEEFHLARERAIAKRRRRTLQLVLETFAREPSFGLIGNLPGDDSSDGLWRAAFSRMSTGHKVVLHIAINLCAHLERRSIVLIDEPEMHLHPPLLAALLKAVGKALVAHDSYAIVATHSPVVLQEVLARDVKVLRRAGDEVRVDPPAIETFAENVSLLTRHVFNLDSSGTDFQHTIEELAARLTVEEIEELFGGQLSSQARSLIISHRRALEVDQ